MSFLLIILQNIFGYILSVINLMFLSSFLNSKLLLKIILKKSIVSMYSDNGGEYVKLKEYFATYGITHLTTPPPTPQHNGTVERHHRHIVDTGLTMLH